MLFESLELQKILDIKWYNAVLLIQYDIFDTGIVIFLKGTKI